jgi:hypothetical protein
MGYYRPTVGNHSRVIELRAQLKSEGGDVTGRHVRTPWSLPLFATFVTFAFVLISMAAPTSRSSAVVALAEGPVGNPQSLAVEGDYANSAPRDTFTTSQVHRASPAVGAPDPGTAQAIAYEMLQAMGMGDDQYSCLVALWNRESHWNVYASNKSSGAYGIPQALPGTKMASAGADWATNPATQITWGLGYITGRYGTPCGAWAHSENVGWY